MPAATLSPPTAHAPLNSSDRCDRCGAQAYVRVVLGSGSELLFCSHHGRKYEAKLAEIAVAVQDETDKLTAQLTAPEA